MVFIFKFLKGFESYGIVGNSIILDSNISDVAISVYAVARAMFFNASKRCSIITLNKLYSIYGVSSRQTKQTLPIKKAILELLKCNLIAIYDFEGREVTHEDINNPDMYIISFLQEDMDNVFIGEGGFTKIPEQNVIAISNFLKVHPKVNKHKFMRYYLIIARFCSNDNQFATISYNKIHNVCPISKSSFTAWNKYLEDINVILYKNDIMLIDSVFGYKKSGTVVFHRNNMKMDNDKYLFDSLVNDIINNEK